MFAIDYELLSPSGTQLYLFAVLVRGGLLTLFILAFGPFFPGLVLFRYLAMLPPLVLIQSGIYLALITKGSKDMALETLTRLLLLFNFILTLIALGIFAAEFLTCHTITDSDYRVCKEIASSFHYTPPDDCCHKHKTWSAPFSGECPRHVLQSFPNILYNLICFAWLVFALWADRHCLVALQTIRSHRDLYYRGSGSGY